MRKDIAAVRNKALSVITALALVVSMTPMPAYAVEEGRSSSSESVQTVENVDTSTPFDESSSSGKESVPQKEVTSEEEPAPEKLVAAEVPEPEHVVFVFDANADDAQGDMDDQDVVLNDKVWKLSANSFTREGYEFVGWSTTKDGKDIKDDPETEEDESFKAFYVPDKEEFTNLGYSYDEEQKDGTSKTINAELTKVVCDKHVTLYAQWKELPVENKDEVEKGEKPSSGGDEGLDTTPGDEKSGESKADDESEQVEVQPAVTIKTESDKTDTTEVEAGKADEGAKASHIETNGLRGVLVQNADTQDEAVEALEEDGLESDDAQDVARTLFKSTKRLTRTAEDALPTSADGNTVESIDAVWMTNDTVDNGDASLLYVRPSADDPQQVRLRVTYALSGEKDYAPGDIVITIPAKMFKDRYGNDIGVEVIPYPEDPGTKGTFNWRQVGDGIQLVNTKRLEAATHGFFDVAFTELVPHTIQDMAVHDWTGAKIEVTTSSGAVIGLQSNTLQAQFDTAAEVQRASKLREGEVAIVDASVVPSEAKVDGEDEYVCVRWYTWAYLHANQTFDLTYNDTVIDSYQSKTANHDAGTDKTVTGTLFTERCMNGTTSYSHFTVYYPLSQFEPDTDYRFENQITYTVTETDPEVGDDPRQVTNQSATQYVVWRYHLPQFVTPTGHFMVYKMGNDGNTWGGVSGAEHRNWEAHRLYYFPTIDYSTDVSERWFGVYPSVLNKLRNGEDVEIAYTSKALGYILPWTLAEGADTRLISSYNQRDITMTVDEDGLAGLTPLVDYTWTNVDFSIKPWIAKTKAVNVNPDGSFTAMYAGDGTFEYETDTDTSHIPLITLSIERNGQWEDYAVIDYTSGEVSLTVAGEHVDGTMVHLPEGVTDLRVSSTTHVSALRYWFRPMATLKADSPHIQAIVDYAFADNRVPSYLQYNTVTMTAERADTHDEIVEITRRGYDQMMGYNTDVRAVPTKSAQQTVEDVNYADGYVTVHYSAQVEERTTITDLGTYRQALLDGGILQETSGVWRDLLPVGMVPDLSSIELRDNDSLKRAYTIEDYQGSGRTLLVVEANLRNTPQQYTDEGLKYWEDVPSISFDATYTLENVVNYGDEIHNVISFETDNDYIGTVSGYKGEPDNPRSGENVATQNAFDNDDERDAMTNLDPSSDGAKFVYAGCWTNLDLLGRGETSLSKEVDVNNEGVFSTGTYDDKRTVYEGGQYTYRLTMISDIGTTSKGMILYDTLENYEAHEGNDPVDIGAPHWKGTLRKVDVSQLESLGIAPVVYYCTDKTLALEDANDNEINTLQQNPGIWIKAEDYTGSLDAVGAVAVDLRKNADGTDFELPEGESVVVLIQMRAPWGGAVRTYIEQDAHAYNNAFLKSTSVDNQTLQEDTKWIRKDYVKVGIEEMNIEVTKRWNDDNDRDGLRPESVTVHLLDDGVDTGRSLTLRPDENGDWKGVFEHVPYTRENGDKALYHFSEEAISGYQSQSMLIGTTGVLANVHVPEKVHLSGTKTWVGDEEFEGVRPQYITVNLYADGVYVTSKSVMANANGDWTYDFGELPKYRDGGIEIEYSVAEVKTDLLSQYIATVDDLNITNTYHPKGDLSVTKLVEQATPTTDGKQFTFTFVFKNANDTPIFDVFNYTTSTGRTGMIATDGSLMLVDGETVTVHELPHGAKYSVSEAEEAGFKTTSSGDVGTIQANQTAEASFSNIYATSGAAQLVAFKTLTGKKITRYQFRFEVYDVTGLEGEERATGGELVRVATNDSDGMVQFGRINYSNADDGHTYTYRVQETDRGKDGYTYDSHVDYVNVSVQDNGDGTMTCSVAGETPSTYYMPITMTEMLTDIDIYGHVDGRFVLLIHQDVGGVDTVGYMADGNVFTPYDMDLGLYKRIELTGSVFNNTYEATGSVNLKAWKDLAGRQVQDQEFEFVMDEVDAEGNIVAGGLQQVKKNNADSEIIWDEIEYDQDDIGKTFYYKMTEVSGNDATVIYDTSVKYYEVVVNDNGDGTLSCSTTSKSDDGKCIAYDVSSSYSLVLVYGDVSAVSGKPSDTANDMFWLVLWKGDVENGIQRYYSSGYSGDYFDVNMSLADMAEAHGFKVVPDDGAFDPENYDQQLTAIRIDNNGDTYTIIYSRQPSYQLTNRIMDDTSDAVVETAPIFKNTLKDGSLRIEKRVTDDSVGYPEDQTFKYRIEFGTPTASTSSETQQRVSHTANISDDGVRSGDYPDNQATKDCITIPGAESLRVEVTYGTENNWDMLYIFQGEYTGSVTRNMNQATTGYLYKLMGGSNVTTTVVYDIPGDTVTLAFYSDGSVHYYGYYATVSATVETTVEGGTPVDIDTSEIVFEPLSSTMLAWRGW